MEIKKMNWLMVWLMPNIKAITLAPFGIYVPNLKNISYSTVNHENIHWKQQMEMLIIFFYIWYILEWVIKFLTPPVGAYEDLCFEREANKFEDDNDYLSRRKYFAWFKYL